LARKTHGMSKKTDWEKLSHNLQSALKDQIAENNEKDMVIRDLVFVINYLEMKLGIYKGFKDGDE